MSPARLITQRGVEVDEMRVKDAAAKLAAEKRGKKGTVKVVTEQAMKKTPRLTALGAAAMVRTKEGDIAKGYKGELVKSVKEKRYRYQNV